MKCFLWRISKADGKRVALTAALLKWKTGGPPLKMLKTDFFACQPLYASQCEFSLKGYCHGKKHCSSKRII
ncbi:hypothetical protein XELAEV_18001727mg [Xenopus laevis]|nr:hypothetical protein XELAEV_18001727mg [Xenopus laevis]